VSVQVVSLIFLIRDAWSPNIIGLPDSNIVVLYHINLHRLVVIMHPVPET
jgi:hypothetical protein